MSAWPEVHRFEGATTDQSMRTALQPKTNYQIACRLSSFQAPTVRMFLRQPGGTMMIEMDKRVIRQILRGAGDHRPAICQFVVMEYTAYVIPLGFTLSEFLLDVEEPF